MSPTRPTSQLARAALLAAGMAWSHGVHASLAVADFNAQSKSLEVTLVASADDIQAVLRRDTGREIEIDRGKDAEKVVADYVVSRLEFQNAVQVKLPVKWIGMEVTVSRMTAYLEVATPDGPAGLRVRNTLLFDFLPDQVNMMTVRRDRASKSSDHVFPAGSQQFQTVRLP